MSVFNHVGLCVTDLDRSRRFYEELFGFTFASEMQRRPTTSSARSSASSADRHDRRVPAARDGLVLELLHYDRERQPAGPERPFNEPGLTHMSICVDDIEATCARVAELGGRWCPTQHEPGTVAIIRDPDGQLIELPADELPRTRSRRTVPHDPM